MPRTVDVPEGLEPAFAAAEELVAHYFEKKSERPDEGTIDIDGERYVLLRAASLSERFFRVAREIYGEGREHEADDFARLVLFDLAHAAGRGDAEEFAERAGADDPIHRLSAGPIQFAYTGWARVQISAESRPSPDEDYYLLYDHPYSFESDAWIRAGASAAFPVCIMSCGYSSGWCETSFGVRLVATELLCRACGDEACRFIMAPPTRIQAHVERWLEEHPAGARPARRVYQIPTCSLASTSRSACAGHTTSSRTASGSAPPSSSARWRAGARWRLSSGGRRRWRPSAASRGGSRTTSTTCSARSSGA